MTRGMKEDKRRARGGTEEEELRRQNSRGKVIGSGTLKRVARGEGDGDADDGDV